jgi:hypothetical protein
MPPKADMSDAAQESPPTSASGKIIILGILAVAFIAAGTSWWFRYNSTRRAARFWGRELTLLIRDAPEVILFRQPSRELIQFVEKNPSRAKFVDPAHDISKARGVLHLRNAMLDDRSFVWPAAGNPWHSLTADPTHWLLSFYDPKSRQSAELFFTKDCHYAGRLKVVFMHKEWMAVSTEPIAAGLREMFAEFTAKSTADAGSEAR